MLIKSSINWWRSKGRGGISLGVGGGGRDVYKGWIALPSLLRLRGLNRRLCRSPANHRSKASLLWFHGDSFRV